MDSIVVIGVVTILLWAVSIWLYFRSSNAQEDLRERMESLTRNLDVSERE